MLLWCDCRCGARVAPLGDARARLCLSQSMAITPLDVLRADHGQPESGHLSQLRSASVRDPSDRYRHLTDGPLVAEQTARYVRYRTYRRVRWIGTSALVVYPSPMAGFRRSTVVCECRRCSTRHPQFGKLWDDMGPAWVRSVGLVDGVLRLGADVGAVRRGCSGRDWRC